MGYIREAQSKYGHYIPTLTDVHHIRSGLGQPLGLWREAYEDDNIPQEDDLPPIPVKAGDRIFADFYKSHTNVSISMSSFKFGYSQQY